MNADVKREKRREANRRYYAKQKAMQATHPAKAREITPQVRQIKVSFEALARSRAQASARTMAPPFAPYMPPPMANVQSDLAMDSVIDPAASWASEGIEGTDLAALYEGFIGYPELSLMAQRPEYRRISETIATEMTREWVEFTSAGDEGKAEKIAKIEAEMKRLRVRDRFAEAAEQDGFFGRSHIYVDLGTTDNPAELRTDIGDGTTEASRQKISRGAIKALRCVEAVWCYPLNYNSSNPLRADWYRPDVWSVQGTTVHRSRLLTFIGREVPDLLKPAYSFGGLSMSQIAKPYVQNWLKTRQSVADIVSAFSIFVLKTDMSDLMSSDAVDGFYRRLSLFTSLRDNRGVFAVDKEREDFQNVSAPLGSLDKLQALSLIHI